MKKIIQAIIKQWRDTVRAFPGKIPRWVGTKPNFYSGSGGVVKDLTIYGWYLKISQILLAVL